MATVRFGDSGPEFGLATETVGFVQAFEQRSLADEALVEDAQGYVVAATYYNQRTEGSISLVKSAAGTIPTYLTSVALVGLVGVSKVVLTELSRKPEQKGYTKYDFTFKAWANISL